VWKSELVRKRTKNGREEENDFHIFSKNKNKERDTKKELERYPVDQHLVKHIKTERWKF
jgi:hypothetical protein